MIPILTDYLQEPQHRRLPVTTGKSLYFLSRE